MALLNLIRASAGSGKTFNLTKNFLRLVLKEPVDYYRRILAVTFTNKATAEMKSRILKELYVLASGKESAHLQYLVNESGYTESRIRNKAQAILNNILHGYSWFKVETIDSFFQGIIRSFVRELGIPGNYKIELDQDKILDESVNRLLDKLDDNNKLVDWLLQYIDTKITEGKSWVVKNELQKLGKSLFKEELVEHLPALEPIINEADKLKSFRDSLFAIMRGYENKLSDLANSVLEKISELDLKDKDFFYKGVGTTNYFKNLVLKKIELPGKRVMSLLDNPDKWASKECIRPIEVQQLGSSLFNPTIVKIIDIINTESKDYNTAVISLKNLHILGLLTHLNQELKALKKEKGIMLISDASPFIRAIINNNDTPFIYEKIGNQINHLLIDEFQDTSSMQWGNFKPLISNSLSNNNDCLLVGDVKQSIYRWRNSNWEILANNVKKEFPPEYIGEEPLDTNWRSSARVINFNNEFFLKASTVFQRLISNESNEYITVNHIYTDVSQQIPPSKPLDKGYINIRLFDKKESRENTEYFGSELITRINEVISKSYLPGEIAFLVRNKKEGSKIADFIINANKEKLFSTEIGVISNESLFLSASPVVNLLVAAMNFVNRPDDRLIAATVYNAHKQVFDLHSEELIDIKPGIFDLSFLSDEIDQDFIELCKGLLIQNLYSIAESLSSKLNLHAVNTEKVYLHSFLDIVFNYGTSELSDLSGFLQYWDEEGIKKTISAAETQESIRILTIHKSKGLEFPVVFVPFCNWSFTPMIGEQLWLTTEKAPYSDLPVIPVNYENLLAESYFDEHYYLENYRTLIDNINMMYVAFTRAENALIAFALNNNSLKDTGDILIKTLEELKGEGKIADLKFNEIEDRYEYGVLPESTRTSHNTNARIFSEEHAPSQLPEVRISSQAQQFMKNSELLFDAANHGRILHATMESIRVVEDIPVSVQKMVLQGILSQKEGDNVRLNLEKAIKNPLVKNWFSEKNTILTETDIIGATGKVRRPDRVIIEEDCVSIIDYKFGSEDENQKYIKQLEDYKYLIKSMGYSNVKGYIWYILENEIIEA